MFKYLVQKVLQDKKLISVEELFAFHDMKLLYEMFKCDFCSMLPNKGRRLKTGGRKLIDGVCGSPERQFQ